MKENDTLEKSIQLARKCRRLTLPSEAQKPLIVRRATSFEDLAAAYNLVGEVYKEKGFIPPGTGPRIRKYEALPQMATFIALSEGKVVGVHSLLNQNLFGLPSCEVFRLEFGEGYCESTNQAISSEQRNGNENSPLAFEMMRCVAAQARFHKSEKILAAVDSRKSFYELLFNARHIATSDDYSKGKAPKKDKAKLVEIPIDRLEEYHRGLDYCLKQRGDEPYLANFFVDKNPYFARLGDWEVDSMRIFEDFEKAEDFFMRFVGLENTCTPQDLKLIRREWAEYSIASQRVR